MAAGEVQRRGTDWRCCPWEVEEDGKVRGGEGLGRAVLSRDLVADSAWRAARAGLELRVGAIQCRVTASVKSWSASGG